MKIKDFICFCVENKVDCNLFLETLVFSCMKLLLQIGFDNKVGADIEIMQNDSADK